MAAQGSGLPLLSPGREEDRLEASEQCGRWARRAGDLPEMEPEEITRRLDTTAWELGNRRKILIRNLPPDCSSQDIHELLQDYEIKYCYVDKNKKTAFITLSDGEQAQDAIDRFHNQLFRERELCVQLQPTDALLCITNLPPLLSLQEFEELVRVYGNTERCLLVYSELSGHSKGYGFVEYMKKDSASRARLELLGKQLEEFTLFAQWIDVNQLSADFIHSRCLCVAKLPKDYSDGHELTQTFSSQHKPLFCQLAEEGGHFGGFAVVEYETAMEAEEVRDAMDGMTVGGSRIQISFCAPGSPGRSVLAALIAAQGMLQNNRRGLLPEPNTAQIMQSLSNPAMLQMLLQPQNRGRSGKHGSSGRPHYVNPTVSQALLQLNKLHQKPPGLAGNLLLQSYPPLQLAQQQLLQLKNSQSNNSKPGLLGEAPTSILQSAMGTAQSVEASQRDIQKNLLPFYHNQHLCSALSRLAQDKSPAASDGSLLTGRNPEQSQPSNTDAPQNKGNNQMSLLGEPPRDFRLSTNPYLNLASVLPGSSLTGLAAPGLQSQAMDGLLSQDSTAQQGLDSYFSYSQNYSDYSQEALQQWYDQYSSYGNTQDQADSGQSSSTLGYGDYGTYIQAPPTYYANAQGVYQAGLTGPGEKIPSSDKRSYLASEVTGGYMEPYPQASADNYSDSYFKRKKIY